MSSRSPLQRTDDAVLYGAAFVATVASTLALTTTVASAGFATRALVAVTAGFATSWIMHARGIRSRALPYLLLVIALVALSPWWTEPKRFMTLIPVEFMEQRDFRLAGVLFLLATLRTFSLVTRGDLLFCVVPGISLFGVMAYRRPDSEFMALFWVFLASSALLAGYDHLLELRARVAETGTGRERTLRRDHLLGTVVLCIICAAVASGAALPLRLAGERYRSKVMGGLAAVAMRRPIEVPGYMLGGDRVPIGTGPAALGESEIMWIKTEAPGNWRLKVYDDYYGRSWGVEPSTEPVTGRTGEFDFEDLVSVQRPDEEQQRHEVHLLRGGDANIASVAPAVKVTLHLADEQYRQGPTTAHLDRHGTVTISAGGSNEESLFQLQRGDWYEVIAQPSAEVDTPGTRSTVHIRTTRVNRPGPSPSPALVRLVDEITKDLEPTDHGAKVRAIQDYLVETCRYNANAPAVPGTERNAIEYFLFKSQEGDCDLFASALCVMCRLAEVPARFVVGYAPGEPGRRANTYVVRERDSHAWAEVFLEGIGWVTVDPTAGSLSASRREAKVPWLRAVASFLRRYSRAIGVLAAIGLALYLIGHLHPVTARRSASMPMTSGPSADVINAYRRACRSLARAGHPRSDSQTPVEYAATCRSEPALATAWPPFEELTWLYIKARYARSGASPDDARRASLALSAVRSGLRHGRPNTNRDDRTKQV